MRDLRRNKRTFYYANFLSKEKVFDEEGLFTGGYKINYTDPVRVEANVSARTGNASFDPFGISLNYSRTITTTDMTWDMKEGSVIWFNRDTDLEPNYVVVKVADSINSITYAIAEAKTNA